MTRVHASLLIGSVLWISTAAWCFAGGWDEVKVLPKSSTISLQKSADDSTRAAGVTEIAWPATVAKVDGQWLKLSDEGAYSAKPAEGWVRKDNVIKLDDAQESATQKIREAKPAAAGSADVELAHHYWLRGIYWENVGEPDNAIADYTAAIAKNPKSGDFHLRLGRQLANKAKRDSKLQPDPTGKSFESSWCAFKKAEAVYGKNCPPQLYLSWGEALSQRFRVTGDTKSADEAMTMFKCAECLSPTWFVAPHRQGKLLLAIFKKTASAAKKQQQQQLQAGQLTEAIEHFTRSIRLNPNAIGPYRDRADALLRLSSFSKASRTILDQASQSSQRANELGNHRKPMSLEVNARIQVAMANDLYPGPFPVKFSALDAKAKALIETRQSLLKKASQLAVEATNLSKTTDAIDRRMGLFAEWSTHADLLADYIAGKPSPIAMLEEANRTVETLLADLPADNADDPERTAAVKAFDRVKSLRPNWSQEEFTEAVDALSKPIARGLESKLTSQPAREKLLRAQETVERARREHTAASRTPAPSYTPLFLNAR